MRAALLCVIVAGLAGCNQVLGVDKFTSIDASASAPDAHVDATLEFDAPTIDATPMIDARPDAMPPDAAPSCGDDQTEPPEQCDTGGVDTATCDSDCTFPSCGDGHTNTHFVVPSSGGKTEQCDAGAANSNAVGATCDTECQIPACGNGVKEGNEACDDGNTTNGDGCEGNCTLPACGNAIKDSGEACDDGNTTNTDDCVMCALAKCGDGFVHTSTMGTTGADGLEQCDTGGGDSATCNGSGAGAVACKAATCGDGYVNAAAGEQCDDGNVVDGDSCEHNCKTPFCGNGIKDPGEQCDDGNSTNGDNCENDCTIPVCGNGIVDNSRGEVCDDHNNNACGTCNATCGTSISPTKATGSFAASPGGSFVDGDKLIINNGLGVITTFEVDPAHNGVQPGNVLVAMNASDGSSVVAQDFISAINSVTALQVSAQPLGANQVTLTNNRASAAGNVPLMTSNPNAIKNLIGMSGGAAGDCQSGVGCGTGADCLSGVCTGGFCQ